MPIYEYCCSDCGHELEALQSVGAPPLRKCPACGKSKLQKKLSAAAFHLKGQGWYKTDFRDQGKKSPAEDKSAKRDESAGKDGATAETSSKPTDNGADKSDKRASDRSKTSTDAPAVASAGDASGKSA